MEASENSTSQATRTPTEKGNVTEQTPADNAFPNGMNRADYTGYESWSDRQWAWEFLRRNMRFRAACNELERFPIQSDAYNKEARRIAKKFYLRQFLHYKTSFKEGKAGPSFNSARIWTKIPSGSKSRTVSARIRKGQVVARFDLLPALHDERIIEAQIEYVRRELKAKLKTLLETEHAKPSTRRNVQETSEQRLAWLRTLDAKYCKVPQAQIYECVFPRLCQADKDAGIPRREWPSKLKSLARKARLIAEDRYLGLALPKRHPRGPLNIEP